MTTATAPDTTAGEKDHTWTLAEVEKQEETLEDLRGNLADLAEREKHLEAAIADAVEAGRDPTDLRAQLQEARSLRADLEPVEPVLEERISHRRHLAYREEARKRLAEIKKKVGGLVGEAPRRAEKAEELAEALVAQLEWLAGVSNRRALLREEALLLAGLFDLEVPDLKATEMDPVKTVMTVRERVGGVEGARDSALLSIRRIRGRDPADAARKIARQLGQLFGEESPVEDLVAQVSRE